MPILSVDASDKNGVGVVGSQLLKDGKRNTVFFYSKKWGPEIIKNMTSCTKEVLGIMTALTNKMTTYFMNSCLTHIICENDSFAAISLMSAVQSNAVKYCRWYARISTFPIPIYFCHVRNSDCFTGPDYLSRLFTSEEEDPKIKRQDIKHLSREQVTIPDKFINKDFTLEEVLIELQTNPSLVDNLLPDDTRKIPKLRKKKIDGIYEIIEQPPVLSQIDNNFQSISKGVEMAPKAPVLHHGVNDALDISPNVNDALDISPNVNGAINIPQSAPLNPQIFPQLFHSNRELTAENLIAMQNRDEDIKSLINSVLKNPKHANSRYKIINRSLLVRLKRKEIKNPSIHDYQIVLDLPTSVNLLAYYHAITHGGYKTILSYYKKYYYSKRAKDMARSIAAGCRHCVLFRLRNNSILQGYMNSSSEPLNTILIDHVYFDPAIKNGLKYIGALTIVDEASRYNFSIPCRSLKTSEVALIFKNLFGNLGGAVKLLMSDNASNLVNNPRVQNVCDQMGIKTRSTLPYNSTSNAICELQNRRMRHVLNTLGSMLNQSWIEVFEMAKIVLNSLPVGQIRQGSPISPYEILFAKKGEMFVSLFDKFKLLDTEEEGRKEFRKQIVDYLEKEKQARIQEYKIRYSSNPMSSLREGALVHRQLIEKIPSKQKPKYDANIFVITERNGLSVTLKNFMNRDDDKIYRCHIKYIKIFIPRKSEYFNLLSDSVQRLLGYPAEKELLNKAAEKGEKLFDFGKNTKSLADVNNDHLKQNDVISSISVESNGETEKSVKTNLSQVKIVKSKNYQESLIDKLWTRAY